MKLSYNKYHNIPYKQLNGIYEVEDYGILYYLNGKKHRLDGPAIEWNDGDKYYYIEGKKYDTKEEFDKVAYLYLNNLQDYL